MDRERDPLPWGRDGVDLVAERKAAFDRLDERGRQRDSASGYLT